MNVLTIVRLYRGLSSLALSSMAGISHSETWKAEFQKLHGGANKYYRIATALGIPLEALLKNDLTLIPLSYFEEHPPQEYLPVPKGKTAALGRAGEDHIFEREKERLSQILPIHAKLVLPFYKMKGQKIGCDILSFDNNGSPLFLEVKTSENLRSTIPLTSNELAAAKKLTASGGSYTIVAINNWENPKQTIEDIPYQSLQKTHDVTPAVYYCTPKKGSTMTGFAYFRKLRGLTEQELAEALHITQGKWSLYETGACEPPVRVLINASNILNATTDELIAEYDTKDSSIDELF